MPERVVVVGAGVVGISTALELARLGRPPLVLEATTVGAGVSGASLAAITRHLAGPADELPFVLESAERWKALSRELANATSIDVELDEVGQVSLVEAQDSRDPDADLAEVAALVEAERAAGLEVAMVDRDAVSALLPLADPAAVAGASWCPGDAKLNALLACRALAAAAAGRGAEIRLGCRVEAIEGGPPWRLETWAGTVEADAVVLATGPWTPFLLSELSPALAAAFVVKKAQCCATERLPSLIEPVVASVAIGIATGYTQLHQTRHGEVLFNTVVEADDPRLPGDELDTAVDPTFLVASARTLARLFPALACVRLLRSWAACEAWTPDTRFVAGPVPQHEGLYVAAGDSGTGFLRAPLLARALAELAVRGVTDVDIHPYDPARAALAEVPV